MNPYVILSDVSLSFLKQLLDSLTKSKAPGQVIQAVQEAIDQLSAHWNDQITKQGLEDLRG